MKKFVQGLCDGYQFICWCCDWLLKKIAKGLFNYCQFLCWSASSHVEAGIMSYFFAIAITVVFATRYEEVFTQQVDWGIFVIYVLSVVVIGLDHYRFFFKKKQT